MSTINTLRDLLDEFLAYDRIRNLSPRTLKSYHTECVRFLDWLESHARILTADRLRRSHLEDWLQHLHRHRTKKGTPLSIKTVRLRITIIRNFLHYLAHRSYIMSKLPSELVSPKEPQLLPMNVLSHAQVKKLLARVCTDTPLGIRDRAILELMYSSGLRAAEILGLNLIDVDLYHATAKVTGKGNKERIVPVGRSALRWLETYIKGIRPFVFIDNPAEQAVFISYHGKRLTYSGLQRLVYIHSKIMGFDIRVSSHTFRRSCTTELIKGGANMYHVKELLGHESLDMLKRYTRLSIQDLKKTHEKTHPRELDSD